MATRKPKKKKTNVFVIILKTLLLLVLVGILAVLAVFYFGGYYSRVKAMKDEADTFVSESTKDTFVPTQTGEIYDAEGNLISETHPEKDSNYLTSAQIPDLFRKAMISIEDKNFYKHGGVDYKAIVRAAKEFAVNRQITQGGSTITMQLARGIFLNNGRSWERKVEEIFIAWDLEKKYSKDQILEFYLNNVYFMNGYYGIASACEGYFNKTPDQLDLSQVAFLCAIPNSPTYYDPLTHPDHTIERRNLIIRNMLDDGVISQGEYDQAVSEEIVLDLSAQDEAKRNENTYVLTYTYKCATEALMQIEDPDFTFRYDFASDQERAAYDKIYNELYDSCLAKLFKGGYRVYTTFDLEKQQMLQDCVDEELADFEETADDGKYKMQGAAVCIDNSTGQVIAMVGGRSQETDSALTLNRAFQSNRQPGSSIKPLVVYTPAFEKEYYPGTYVMDEEIEDGPKNSGGSYLGEIELSEAVQRSLNTVAWQVYENITPKYGLSKLKAMHFSTIVDSDNVLATSLGGFTYGVKPVEMASGYCTIYNDGKFRIPTCISRIDDYKGNTIYTYDGVSSKVYDINAAREMVSVLQGVMEEGWGTGRGLKLNNQMPCAGKTGTTDEAKDGWFCGFTHYYTTSVWVGCDTPESVRNLQGASWPGRIWKNYMNLIHENLEPVEFKDYDHAKEDRALKDQESHDDDWDNKPQDAATKKTTKTELTPAAATAKIVVPDTTPETPADDSSESGSNSGSGSSTSGGTEGGGTEGGGTEGGGTEGGGTEGGGTEGGGTEAGGGTGTETGGEPTAQNTQETPSQPQG
ncbi:MAG: transglycosylase domain-containing protein [Lachnospiraceae bacterium]|nr:transglycosylase domain-containing protein [Lachnospiraceae bacterium]